MGRSYKKVPTHEEVVEHLRRNFHDRPTKEKAAKKWPQEWLALRTLIERKQTHWTKAVRDAGLDAAGLDSQCLPPLCQNEATMKIEIPRHIIGDQSGRQRRNKSEALPLCPDCYALEMQLQENHKKRYGCFVGLS